MKSQIHKKSYNLVKPMMAVFCAKMGKCQMQIKVNENAHFGRNVT